MTWAWPAARASILPCPRRQAGGLALVGGWLACAAATVLAQPGLSGFNTRFELSETVQLDRADRTTLAYLDRVKQYSADKRWGEAIQTLRQVMEQSGEKLLPVTESRYVSVRDYCNLQLASLPAEALALYRSQVDPQARQWYEEGVARQDRRLLGSVVQQAFASSWADDALAALGELALERGDYAAARSFWEKIIPVRPPEGQPSTWLAVPDTDRDLASIRARLVLVSILEGSRDRAKDELAALAKLHPGAKGRLGGRVDDYAQALGAMLEESAAWPQPQPSADWPTLGGSPEREKIAPCAIDASRVVWRVPLPPSAANRRQVAIVPWASQPRPKRVAEDASAPLSFHPVVVGNLALVNTSSEILALDLCTGGPAWGHGGAAVYRDELNEAARSGYQPVGSLGVPRFTMTVYGNRLYARMGSAVTSPPADPASPGGKGYLVALDLEAQGRLVWKIAADEPGWAFEGSPVADEGNVYAVMRRSDIQPQIHVACFDAQTGVRRWRRFVCAAETPARGMFAETSHTLLTLAGQTLYLNTNLGCVAALAADDGGIRWVSLYPRIRKGDLLSPPKCFSRDLNPCVYDRGILFVAPADNPRILALESATGQILWQTGPEVEDAVHLLGVAGDHLFASGNRLYWISLKRGPEGGIEHVWPDSQEKLGYGRGLLAGNRVYWPTREKIYVFDPATGQPRQAIDLAPRGVEGGNLVIASGRLLIATSKELIALGPGREIEAKQEGELAGQTPRRAMNQAARQRVTRVEKSSQLPLTPDPSPAHGPIANRTCGGEGSS